MKNYIITRCVFGIIGSIVAILMGVLFVVEAIRSSVSQGYLYGALATVAGCVGILICVAFLKKANKLDDDKDYDNDKD